MEQQQVKRLGGTVEKKSKLYLISNIISFVYLIISIICVYIVSKFNILPTKYLLIITALLILMPIIVVIIQLKTKKKKKLKIFLNFFSFIMCGVLAIVSVYFYRTNQFLSAMQSSGYKIQNYSVMVLKESSYEKIDDIKGKMLGYIDGEDSGVKIANDEIKKTVDVTLKGAATLAELTAMLTEKETEAIMVEDSYKTILEEEDKEFMDKVKIIHTFSIQVPVDEISKDVKMQEPFNIYISGIDTYGKIQTVSRSDVNIVVTINPNTHQVLLTNIPRDSYVQLYNTVGVKDKLTHAGIYGVEKSVKTIEKLLDIDINYYFKVNFTSLENIVDAIGGITAYSKYTFTSYIGTYYFKEGWNNMNGKQALGFARERKSFPEGDIMRGQNQQAVIEAIIRKVQTPSIIGRYNTLLSSLAGKFETNMPTDKITEFIKNQLDNLTSWNVTSITLTGSGSSQVTYSGGSQKLSVLILDEDSIEEAKQKIDLVMQGETLESSYGEVINPRDTTKGTAKQTTTNTTTKKNDNTTNTQEQQVENKVDNEKENNNNVDIYGNKISN